MCTSLFWQSRFGRNLDWEQELPSSVILTPHRFPLPNLANHHALLGMAWVQNSFPLYFDAMNDAGLAMAGLRFADSAHYGKPVSGRENIPSWYLIPWLLGQCGSIPQVRQRLPRLQITDEAFSPALPPSPLHWMIADRDSALILEACRDGLHWYDAPIGVLTNEPPFADQLAHWAQFEALTPSTSASLPGGAASSDRFVRAAFTRRYADPGETSEQTTLQFFRILDSAATVQGCVRQSNGRRFYTRYTSCCDLVANTYACRPYWEPQIHVSSFSQVDSAAIQPQILHSLL